MTGSAVQHLRRSALRGFLLLIALPLHAATPHLPVELEGSGWLVGGSRPQDYDVELEPEGGRDGSLAASLRAVASSEEGFVTLMRWVDAGPFRGRRLRLTAWVKAEALDGWAGLWMRIDDDDRKRPVAFDNMQDRAIRGTRDWRRYQVVLDVPEAGDRIFYGILLGGPGRAWVDDFELEEVGEDVPVTDTLGQRPEPVNLDFDHPPAESPP